MNIIQFIVKKKYLVLAWGGLIACLTSLGFWVHKEMQNMHEFQGTFAVIPEEEDSSFPQKNFKTIEKIDHTASDALVSSAQPAPLSGASTSAKEPAPTGKDIKDEQLKNSTKVSVAEQNPHLNVPILSQNIKNIQKDQPIIPYRTYSRSFSPQNLLPKVIIVITGLGQSLENTLKVIEQFPPEVTLGFIPYARNTNMLMNQSRIIGHENLLLLPMEPESYPGRDPGPYTLLTDVEASKNLQKLETVLNKGLKFVGVTNFMGSRLMASEKDLEPIFQKLKEKGYLFLENTSSLKTNATKVATRTKLPYIKATRLLDPATSLTSLEDQLKEMEKIAVSQGYVILYVFTYPKVIDTLKKWIKTLKDKGFTLAPLTSVYRFSDTEVQNGTK